MSGFHSRWLISSVLVWHLLSMRLFSSSTYVAGLLFDLVLLQFVLSMTWSSKPSTTVISWMIMLNLAVWVQQFFRMLSLCISASQIRDRLSWNGLTNSCIADFAPLMYIPRSISCFEGDFGNWHSCDIHKASSISVHKQMQQQCGKAFSPEAKYSWGLICFLIRL